ncbi:MAG: YabP/YqfC family sporulation protein [Oscillospiraceae bacterium]|nr:YabP/YqfC family sporulation protein [Oscillospiraceae bacterium]
MMPKKHWAERLVDGADLSGEPMPGVPVVELAGDRRVLIERHGGVTEYSGEKICVKVRYGTVAVCGCGLELTCMTREQLVITGRIDSLQLLRRRA